MKWVLGIVLFYTLFILIWKGFWDVVEPLPPLPKKKEANEDDKKSA